MAYLAIAARPGSLESRRAIRSTWLSSLRSLGNYEHSFFIGRSEDEQEQSPTEDEELDVVVLPFLDTYYNLSTKIGLMLHHATSTTNCSVVVKVDEDIYIHPQRFHRLLTMMLREAGPKGVYGGKLWMGSKPVRDPGDKFYLPYETYPNPTYPPYALGALYIMSSTVIRRLPFTIEQVGGDTVPSFYLQHPPLIRFEDVFFGDMVANLPEHYRPTTIDIPHLVLVEGRSAIDRTLQEPTSALCQPMHEKLYIGIHDLSPESIRILHDAVQAHCPHTVNEVSLGR